MGATWRELITRTTHSPINIVILLPCVSRELSIRRSVNIFNCRGRRNGSSWANRNDMRCSAWSNRAGWHNSEYSLLCLRRTNKRAARVIGAQARKRIKEPHQLYLGLILCCSGSINKSILCKTGRPEGKTFRNLWGAFYHTWSV